MAQLRCIAGTKSPGSKARGFSFHSPPIVKYLIFYPVMDDSHGYETLVFAKYPELGRCKTRLAAGIGDVQALAVYQALLDHTLSVVRGCPGRKILFVDPPERADDAKYWAPGMDAYLPQSQGDLGFRLSQAVNSRLDAGATRLILLGSDCPQISKDSVISSLKALDSFDTILGPTEDGGYYLLGLKGRHPFLFQDIPWSTEKVLEKTLNILKIHSLSYLLRETLFDVDTPDDFDRARHYQPLKRLGIG